MYHKRTATASTEAMAAKNAVCLVGVAMNQVSQNDVAIMMRNWAENPCRKE